MTRFAPLTLLALATGCGDGGINLFSIDEDIELGQQVRDEILADAETYPVVYEDEYPEAYAHLYRVRDEVLASGEVTYAEEFEWELYLIDDPDTLNAFCAPGGYIFIYTGLMEFLEYEDEFAGVMGHEMAHADRRHSTQQLTRSYGVSSIIEVLLGEDAGLAAEIAAGLAGLKFSRTHEAEADDYSVQYLCETDYAADGAAGFFEKLESYGLPDFISTHPSSETRVEDIHSAAEAYGCSVELNPNVDYDAVLDTLP